MNLVRVSSAPDRQRGISLPGRAIIRVPPIIVPGRPRSRWSEEIIQAAPTITSVTGAFASGQTLTINSGASDFGSKSPAKPQIWGHFTGQTVGAAPTPDATYSVGGLITQNALVSNVIVPAHRNRSVRSETNIGVTAQLGSNISESDHVFTFCRRYFTFPNWNSPLMRNFKMMRHWAFQVDRYPNVTGYVGYNEQAMSWENGGPDTGVTGTMPPLSAWYIEETEVSNVSPGNSGVYRLWNNGVLLANRSDGVGNVPRYDKFTQINIQVSDEFGDKPNTFAYFADLYLDISWARVMVGNAATWLGCTVREPQLPTTWGASQILVDVNQGSLSSGWVYVVDATGAVNANGVATPSGNPPAAPTGLRLVP